MTLSPIPTGFDYARAVLDLRGKMSYEEIAYICGYEGPSSVFRVMNGVIPSHPRGEAIWALYVRVFKRKPPVSKEQAHGIEDFSFMKCAMTTAGSSS